MVIQRFAEALGKGGTKETEQPRKEEAPKPQEADTAALEETADRVLELIERHRHSEVFPFSALTNAKEEYLREHPERREIAEILFELPAYLHFSKDIILDANYIDKTAAVRNIFLKFAGFNRAVVRHLITNGHDYEYTKEFWQSVSKIAQESPEKEVQLNQYRAGWLAETATYHILESLGEAPSFSSPEDDAFGKADFYWRIPGQEEVPVAVQVKTRKGIEGVIINVEYDVSPKAITKGGETKIYDTRRDSSKEAEHRPLIGRIVIRLPHHGFSWRSGFPLEETLNECKKQYEAILEELEKLRG